MERAAAHSPASTASPAKFILLLFIAALLLPCLISCTEKTPVKIGLISGQSGRNGDLGVSGRDGAQLAVDEINANGGIGGRKIELIIKDDRSDPEEGKKAARELADAKVVAIVGPFTSNVAMSILPVITEAKILTIGPTVSSNDLTGLDDYFLRLNMNNDTAAATASHISGRLAAKKAAIVFDISNRSYSGSLATVFRKSYQTNGGRIVADLPFNSKEKPDFKAIAADIVSSHPEAVFVIAGAIDSAMVCQNIRQTSAAIPLFIAEWGGTGEFIKAAGASAEGVMIFQHFNTKSQTQPFQSFAESYRKRFGEAPAFAAAYSYESIRIIAESLAKSPNPARLKESILSIGRFKGLQGDILLDRYGDPQRPFTLMSVNKGEFRPLQ